MLTKTFIKNELEDCGVNAIIINDLNCHAITVIVKDESNRSFVEDFFYENCPIGIMTDIQVDITLICHGVCFTEINFLPEIKKSFFNRLWNYFFKPYSCLNPLRIPPIKSPPSKYPNTMDSTQRKGG